MIIFFWCDIFLSVTTYIFEWIYKSNCDKTFKIVEDSHIGFEVFVACLMDLLIWFQSRDQYIWPESSFTSVFLLCLCLYIHMFLCWSWWVCALNGMSGDGIWTMNCWKEQGLLEYLNCPYLFAARHGQENQHKHAAWCLWWSMTYI